MHRLISDNHEAIASLCRRYRVSRLEVFGSAARSADFDEDLSDADFLVEVDDLGQFGALEQFFGLRSELSVLLGRRVDLVEPGAIRNPYIRGSIDQAREVVYAA